MRQFPNHFTRGLSALVSLMLVSAAARAEPADKPSAEPDATVGSRSERLDGSVAMTMSRRLPTEWETKVGTDVSLAGPPGASQSDYLLRGTTPNQSTGTLWGTISVPSPAPMVWDKTTVEARVDPSQDQARLGATLSRSVPLGHDVSVTIQNSYSITEARPDRPPAVPLTASSYQETAPDGAWAADQTVRLNIAPSGTSLSAGGAASSADDQWHPKLSIEQNLFGPLKVTTSVEDAGTLGVKKSILAAFKHVW